MTCSTAPDGCLVITLRLGFFPSRLDYFCVCSLPCCLLSLGALTDAAAAAVAAEQTELMARMEANPEVGVTAQDLEIATQRALEQAV